MVRLARVVIPGIPHHVTQRGNGRARTFVGNHDYALYRDLLAEHCRAAGVEVWAWCLMPNHVHLTGKDDGITARAPIRARFPRFACSLPSRMATCWRVCAVPRASADRWETIDF